MEEVIIFIDFRCFIQKYLSQLFILTIPAIAFYDPDGYRFFDGYDEFGGYYDGEYYHPGAGNKNLFEEYYDDYYEEEDELIREFERGH